MYCIYYYVDVVMRLSVKKIAPTLAFCACGCVININSGCWFASGWQISLQLSDPHAVTYCCNKRDPLEMGLCLTQPP